MNSTFELFLIVNDWKPWFVVDFLRIILLLPIVALVVSNIVFMGNNVAELFSSPFSVIFRSLLNKYLFSPTSVGVNQFILPFQKSLFFVEGVPPPTILAISLIWTSFHSPSNSGNLSSGTFFLIGGTWLYSLNHHNSFKRKV